MDQNGYQNQNPPPEDSQVNPIPYQPGQYPPPQNNAIPVDPYAVQPPLPSQVPPAAQYQPANQYQPTQAAPPLPNQYPQDPYQQVQAGPYQNQSYSSNVPGGAVTGTGLPTYTDQPVAGYPSPYEQAAPASYDTQGGIFSRINKRLLIPVVVVLVLLAAGGFFYINSQNNNPTNVFNKALANSLTTKQVELNSSSSGITLDIKYDFTRFLDPKISSKATVSALGLNETIEGYGSLQNTFIKYTASNIQALTGSNDPSLNKWLSLRKNGVLEANTDQQLNSIADPRQTLFNEWIFGNFNTNQKSQLLNYAKTHSIYQFDAKKISKGTESGVNVYIYHVTLNIANLIELNKKAADIYNIPQNDQQNISTDLNSIPKNLDIYISPQNARLVKAVESDSSTTVTTTFSNYNKIKMPSEPKADLTYKQYLNLTTPTASQ